MSVEFSPLPGRLLIYALGGGLGHVTRTVAWAASHPEWSELHFLVSPGLAGDRRYFPETAVVSMPPGDLKAGRLRDWLVGMIRAWQPAGLLLDAFPCGILGECSDLGFPGGMEVIHLARLLRWEVYRDRFRGAPPRFSKTWILEPLQAPHDAVIRENSREIHEPSTDRIHPLPCNSPQGSVAGLPPGPTDALRYDLVGLHMTNHQTSEFPRPDDWLVIHAGMEEETRELLAYALDLAALGSGAPCGTAQGSFSAAGRPGGPVIRVICPGRRPSWLPAHVGHLDLYPCWPFFSTAGRLISGAGFNIINQARPWREKHHVVPFPRALDDQFLRTVRYRADQALPDRIHSV